MSILDKIKKNSSIKDSAILAKSKFFNNKDMIQTAKMAGIYQSRYMSQNVDKIQIVTIQEIIEDKKRLDIRLMFEVLKSAEKQRETQSIQIPLDI